MSEQELIKQLNNLRQIKPSAYWKQRTKEILLAQIEKNQIKSKQGFYWTRVFSFSSQPAWAMFAIMLVISGIGVYSYTAGQNIKPGTSLYIARILSEKAKLAMTFNQEERVKLDLKLAHNRAKEIAMVLADPEFNKNNDNQEKVVKLTKNFNEDLNIVRENLVKVVQNKQENGSEDASVSLSKVIGADYDKEQNGIDINDSDSVMGIKIVSSTSENIQKPLASTSVKEKIEKASSSPEILPIENRKEPISSTTNNTTVSTTTKNDLQRSLEDTLNRVEQNFSSKDFEKAKEALDEAEKILDNIDQNKNGQVKGVATSTTIKF